MLPVSPQGLIGFQPPIKNVGSSQSGVILETYFVLAFFGDLYRASKLVAGYFMRVYPVFCYFKELLF